jgi:hypothetical protein
MVRHGCKSRRLHHKHTLLEGECAFDGGDSELIAIGTETDHATMPMS